MKETIIDIVEDTDQLKPFNFDVLHRQMRGEHENVASVQLETDRGRARRMRVLHTGEVDRDAILRTFRGHVPPRIVSLREAVQSCQNRQEKLDVLIEFLVATFGDQDYRVED